MEVKNANQEI